MKKNSLLTVALLSTTFSSIAIQSEEINILPAAKSSAVIQKISDVLVFKGGEGGSSHYRIPTSVVAKGGAILAFAEGRSSSSDAGSGNRTSVKLRRSVDQGKTWGPYTIIAENHDYSYSDPRPIVDDRTGAVYIFFARWDRNCAQNGGCVHFNDDSHDLLYRVSYDHGYTWSEAKSILKEVNDYSWNVHGYGRDARATWSITPSQAQLDRAKKEGWELSWRSRVSNGTCNVQYFSDGKTRYLVNLSVLGDEKKVYAGFSEKVDGHLVTGFNSSGYNDYKINSSPNGNNVVLYINGRAIASSSGESTSAKTITFGNGCSSKDGASNYKWVKFTIGNKLEYEFDAKKNITDQGPISQGWKNTSAARGQGRYGYKSINSGPGKGIRLENGRLIFPAIVLDAYSRLGVVSIYSDDRGRTWQAGNHTPTYEIQPSESDLVQLDNGNLLLTARNDGSNRKFNRHHFVSEDNGLNWILVPETISTVNGRLFSKIDQVDVGLLKFDSNTILMSAPQGNHAVSDNRTNLALWIGKDNGTGNYDFVDRIQLTQGFAGYSDMVKFPSQSNRAQDNLGILYEKEPSTEIRFMVYDMSKMN